MTTFDPRNDTFKSGVELTCLAVTIFEFNDNVLPKLVNCPANENFMIKTIMKNTDQPKIVARDFDSATPST